ncbi:MAG TPA: ATP-binding protein [Polyangiales bacterium]
MTSKVEAPARVESPQSPPPSALPKARSAGVSVRSKLILLAVGTAVIALSLACAAFVYYDRVSYSEAKRGTLSVLVQSVSQSAFGPTAFQDKDSATVILKVLAAEPSAQGGAIYAQDGALLASWVRPKAPYKVASKLSALGAKVGYVGDRLLLRHAIGDATQQVGTLHVQFSTLDIAQRTRRFLEIAGVVLLVASLGALLLALFAQRVLTRPVQILFDAAHRVQEHKDFDVRAQRVSDDELGLLTDAFNDMLSMIQARDRELDSHRIHLEVLVADRTRDLDQRNQEMRLVLGNVDQGLVTVDRNGVMGPERSEALRSWFGDAGNEALGSYVNRTCPGFEAKLAMAWGQLIDGLLPLELNLAQLPTEAVSPNGRYFAFNYRPIGVSGDDFEKLLVIVSDVTARVEKERSDAAQAQIIAMFEHVNADRTGFLDFFEETDATVARLTGTAQRDRTLEMRELHTLKGNFGLFGLKLLATLVHRLEDECLEAERGPNAEQKARLHAAWEQVASRARSLLGDGAMSMTVGRRDVEELLEALRAGLPQEELTQRVSRLLLDPVAPKLSRIGERARSLAERLGKGPIDVAVEADGVRAPGDIGWLWVVLPHVVANSVDHGLDSQSERSSVGKQGPATLRLTAKERNRSLIIEIADNGRGIDWDRVRDKAKRLGLPHANEQDLVQALFSDGVSTKDEASEVSGRGIGLAAVAAACKEHGASVRVSTQPGQGTVFQLTLAHSNRGRPSLPVRRSLAS